MAPKQQQLKPLYSGDLPVHARQAEIIDTILNHPVVVIAGETGSGKTTQIPKFLLDCGLGRDRMIACTQPRRVAALSVAQRIAEELKVDFGCEVGAKIRFTDKTSKSTAIKIMTDGILLNELQEDPLLRAYDAVMIDEAHERSLNIDFIIGCLRQILRKRTDLKIVITSATIDTARFSEAFDHAPVIEVSGRMYPVETYYRPLETDDDEDEELGYLEAAAKLTCEIVEQNQSGDILIFLPGERDIHELRGLLDASAARSCDLLPLYGRLANADQQRIFHPGGRRRIILSTNIAETSLTVPGIRYVIDTGLARISRYSPHSHTLRLPVEPIAQSSANQRKGRCGRVSNGICYRLYSEQDFLSRPEFTTPEIHRSNLATVILRMLAFRLGDIRDFPFLEPPSEHAIRGGFRLLNELGAIAGGDEDGDYPVFKVTKIGRRLAQFPVDPTVGRMLLQAEQEGAVAEVSIIAAALSIQDPRERPADLAKEADEMQKVFVHPESDFLTLLNIWNAFHEQMETLSQGQLRKFCKRHFLSFQRMREWRDIHQQLYRLLNEKRKRNKDQSASDEIPADKNPAAEKYDSIHRSILTGLLSNIAVKESGHEYRGPRNRKAFLFPGSGLFDHQAAKKERKAAYSKGKKSKPTQTSAPDWIVCGEWMETSRLFARTAAKIEVAWVEDLAADLIQTSYSEPFWSEKSAAALCKERKVLFGLELQRRHVSLTTFDPTAATEIFIRNGLIEGGIKERPRFLLHNQRICEEAESELARRRLGSGALVEDRLFDFYFERLVACGSFAELRRFAKTEHQGSLDFLESQLADLLPEFEDEPSNNDFPRSVDIGGIKLPLSYRSEPGTETDGVTLQVPLAQFDALREGALDWAVPGHLEEKVESLLRGLPKSIRVALHPLKERASEIRLKLRPSERPLWEQLATLLRLEYGVQTERTDWNESVIPGHLKPRIEIQTPEGDFIVAGRNLESLRARLKAKKHEVIKGSGLESIPAWQAAAQKIEQENLNAWTFGDLPESIDLSGEAGLPIKAFPALVEDQGAIHLRLMPDQGEALRATEEAWPALGEKVLGRELAWVQQDLRALKQIGPDLIVLGDSVSLQAPAWHHLRRHLFRHEDKIPLRAKQFETVCQRADQERRGIVQRFLERLKTLLEAHQEVNLILRSKQTQRALSFPGMREQLDALVPGNLLDCYDFDELPDLTRFLKAMVLRAERAKEQVQRDIDKAQRVAPFQEQLKSLEKKLGVGAKPYRILLEEFRVSVFAQEIGTGQKVSEKRLQKLAATLENEKLNV